MTVGSDFVLRELVRPEEIVACQALQNETWGEGFSERVPYSLLLVTVKTGGLLAGAFDAGERLQGFVFGLTGYRDGRALHWSHMLAVRPEARGRGLGLRLKRFQRELLLARGIEDAYWTFDPLVARNAHLNLNRLGVEVTEYVPDMYGTSTRSPLHGDEETDRLVVRWRLGSERVRRVLAGAAPHGGGAGPASSEEASLPGGGRGGEAHGRPLRIEIPCDLDQLLREEPGRLPEWRRRTRRAFQEALGAGFEVVGFRRYEVPSGPDAAARDRERCHYVLSHISSNSS